MYNYFNASGGDFSLCLYEPELAVNNECRQAIPLSVRTSCQAETFSNMFVTGDLVSEPSCGYYKGGDVWFTAIMPPTGIMRISKERIGGATHPALAFIVELAGRLPKNFAVGMSRKRRFPIRPWQGSWFIYEYFHSIRRKEADFHFACTNRMRHQMTFVPGPFQLPGTNIFQRISDGRIQNNCGESVMWRLQWGGCLV